MNLDEKPRPSVLDTLRPSLLMKWLVVLRNSMWILCGLLSATSLPMVTLLQTLGLSRNNAHNFVVFLIFSTGTCWGFLSFLVAPNLEQERQARESLRQQKLMEEHQKILERWKREVKPEGEAQNTDEA